jgi:signal transduction histidine kinase
MDLEHHRDRDSMTTERHFFRRHLTPLQWGLLIAIAVLIIALEAAVVIAYINVNSAANIYEQSSFGTTNLANVQREALLLEIESDNYLDDPDGDIQTVLVQRAILANHLQVTKAQFSNNTAALARINQIEETISVYDAWLASLPENPSAELRTFFQISLDPIIEGLDEQLKEFYDSQEQAYFAQISSALRTQRTVQTLLIGVSVATLLLTAASALSLRRSVSADFERAYHLLEAEVAMRRQSELNLAQARDQAIEASRFKTQLLAKVSHELRTPLGAIMGYTELLQNGIFGPLSPEQKNATAEVIDSTDYLTMLVNQLLDQAQNESAAVQLHITAFEPAALLHQVEAQMSVLARNKGLFLRTEVTGQLPFLLRGDRDRLQQILVNLVGNAIKFTESGHVEVCFFQPDTTHWAIQVADTGLGIPQEAQAYIFEPFRQVDGSITRQHTGTGLGLTIVQQLVHLMGGEIKLDSEVGRGSTFTILLPLEPAEEKVR